LVKRHRSNIFYGYIIVAASFFLLLITWGTHYSFGVFFKPLLAEFGWTRAVTSGAFSLSNIIHGLINIAAGKLTDKLGPRIVVVVFGSFLGLGLLLMSQISTVWQLYLVYGVIIAIGTGACWIPILSTVARWFVKRRSMITGITASGVGMGTLIMPLLVTYLIYTYDWRSCYIIVGIMSLVIIILAAQFMKRDPHQMGQQAYGENEVQTKEPVSGSQGLTLREALRTRQFWMFSTTILCFGLCLYTIALHIIPHAIDIGMSATAAASIMAIVGGLSIPGRIALGSIADRIGNKPAIVICLTLMTAALLWLSMAKEAWMLYVFATIYGFAYAGFGTLESPMVAELFGLKEHGAITGSAVFGATVGGTIGPVLAGAIFDITGTYTIAFLICTFAVATGAMLVLLIKPVSKKEETNESRISA